MLQYHLSRIVYHILNVADKYGITLNAAYIPNPFESGNQLSFMAFWNGIFSLM